MAKVCRTATLLLFFILQNAAAFLVSSKPAFRSKFSSRLQAQPNGAVLSDAPVTIGTATLLLPQNALDVPSLFGSKSPVENPSWLDAANHLARKTVFFSNATIDVNVVCVPDKKDDITMKRLLESDALIAMGMTDAMDVDFTRDIFRKRLETDESFSKCQFALECNDNDLPAVVGPYNTAVPSPMSVLAWTDVASGQRLHNYMSGMFSRWTSDDFCVALVLYFNQFVAPVDWVKYSVDATWEKGPLQNAQEFKDMIAKCGPCISKCLANEECRTCLTALTEVDTRDQVTSYRTIVSYESELLRDFSLCILQKNNIFQCSADIPTIPRVEPLTKWRGKTLTKEMGQALLIGHLDDEDAPEQSLKLPTSWKVAAGANVAYDQFPCQNQLFYKDEKKKGMWYDPVFRVETIDGRSVWCKRHYRVRNGPKPGTFYFSVLDNGVTSNEYWNIVGAADDLSWIVFHYAGAAGAVGQQYLGGLLCTPNGELPSKDLDTIHDLLESAGIAPWELFVVNNSDEHDSGPPPLDYYRTQTLQKKKKAVVEVA